MPIEVAGLRRTSGCNGQRQDDCIGCHMPRSSSSNNAHVATTNHRIPRNETDRPEPRRRSVLARSARRPSLVNFHRDLMSEQDRALTERDRGIALCRRGGDGPRPPRRCRCSRRPFARRPDDLAALECKGEVLGRLGRPDEGLAAYRLVLAADPTRQTAIEGAAHLASRPGQNKTRSQFWKQAIAVDPRRSGYHAELGPPEGSIRDWPTAAAGQPGRPCA